YWSVRPFVEDLMKQVHPKDVIFHYPLEILFGLITFENLFVVTNKFSKALTSFDSTKGKEKPRKEREKREFGGEERKPREKKKNQDIFSFCGFYSLEKAAAHASSLLGRTGKHLFLRDGDNEKPPILLQKANDTDDLPFISALRSFRHWIAYANARYGHLVGWSTSSLRRRSELPKRQNLSRIDKYPHVVNVELAKPVNTQEEMSLEGQVNAMIRGLTKMSWERVDIDFSGTKQRLLVHSTIQVKTYCVNSAGADVIQHMIDNFLL
ncbi:hypothetical protein LOK49_LG13G01723, partial [Camellia lanceoleosa]